MHPSRPPPSESSPPKTPSPRSASPHSSPRSRHLTPSSAAPSDLVSDDERLDGSFLLVNPGEEDEVSTVGSSLRDSVIGDVFSDSSSEPIEQWEGSTDGGSSDHDHEHNPRIPPPGSIYATLRPDRGLPPSPPSNLGGSYIDAEATATDLDQSRSTIHDLSDSHVRLIMPDPASSFLTSSDGSTPSASMGNLRQLGAAPASALGLDNAQRRLRARESIDREWLEASSRLWNIGPEVQGLMRDDRHFFNRLRREEDHVEYMLLASQDDVSAEAKKNEGDAVDPASDKVKERAGATPSSSRRQQVRAALAAANLANIKGLARRWSPRMSALAMTSLISLVLYHFFGPSAISYSISRPGSMQGGTADPTVLSGGRTDSVWSSYASVGVDTSATTKQPPAAPLATPLIPDLQLIKQALSTFSSISDKAKTDDPAATESPVDEPTPAPGVKSNKRKRKSSASKACCAVAIPHAQVGLSVHTASEKPDANDTWSRAIRRKISRHALNESAAHPVVNTSHSNRTCECGVSRRRGAELVSTIVDGLGPLHRYVASARLSFMTIYAPVTAELRKEWGEVIALAREIAETTSTLIQFVIRRAARGAYISRRGLESATERLRANMPPVPQPHIDTQALVKARERLDRLSEYVEDQAASLADYIEEQTLLLHDKSMESLHQARRGLDKLIAEARKVVVDRDDSAKTLREPSLNSFKRPSRPMRPVKERVRLNAKARRSLRKLQREERKVFEAKMTHWAKVRGGLPEPEERTRMGKMWDMVYHGAVALVL